MSSPSRRLPAVFRPADAASWRRARRHAVPRSMIERAAERRLAGDWRGACAAALVDVAFDLFEVTRQRGTAIAGRLEADLLHLVPDLVRWHLPRVLSGRSSLATGLVVPLAFYGAKRRGQPPACLYVRTPDHVNAAQRLLLELGPVSPWTSTHSFALSRHVWDARRTHELRERCGGAERPPFFTAAGAPAGREDPPRGPRAGDPAARTEWVTRLQDRGRTREAWEAAGLPLDTSLYDWQRPAFARAASQWLSSPWLWLLAPTQLVAEGRRLLSLCGGGTVVVHFGRAGSLLLEGIEGSRPCAILGAREEVAGSTVLPEACWRRLPDLDLLRFGLVQPDELHPLVRAALFPQRPSPAEPAGPPEPRPPAPVRVRCRGAWHMVGMRDGRLRALDHPLEEERRELVVRALGGAVQGCFSVQQAWRDGGGWLPRALRAWRDELRQLVLHGDTPGVLRLLDAGLDPLVRDGQGRTLLHLLPWLDHDVLLHRLLEAGLDVRDRDHRGSTPLHGAVLSGGSPALVRALLRAGADPTAQDNWGWSPLDLARAYRRRDLGFLEAGIAEDAHGAVR